MRRVSVGCLAAMCVLACSVATRADVQTFTGQVKSLRVQADRLKAAGKLDVYGSMRISLLERFLTYYATDLANKREKLVAEYERDFAKLIADESARLSAIEAGSVKPVDSPRRVKDDLPKAVDGHLQQKMRWSDGRVEERPMILFGFGHFNGMRNDIAWLGSLGANYAQSEIGPDQILKAEGVWHQESIDSYRAFMKNAASQGVLVDLLLSPHYMPAWAIEKHPDWYAHLGGFLRVAVNRPELRKFLASCAQKAVTEFSQEGNLWSCCVMNEPAFMFWGNDPDTRWMWVEYMKKKYQTLDAVNKQWGSDYKQWTGLPIVSNHQDEPYANVPYAYDFMRFGDERIMDFTAWYSKVVHSANPKLYTHAKQVCRFYSAFDAMQSSDIDLMPRATDLPGQDTGDLLTNTLYRCVTGKSSVNSELHILSDASDGSGVPQNFVRSSLWLQTLTGEDAYTAWSWERDDSANSPFVGLFPYRLGASEEYFRTGLDLNRVMPEIVALRNQPMEVAVLYSRTSVLRNTPKAPETLQKNFDAMLAVGVPIGAVTEQMVAHHELAKKMPALKVLVLVGCSHLPEDVVAGLKDFTAGGGKLVLVAADEGAFDAYCRKREKTLAELMPKSIVSLAGKSAKGVIDWSGEFKALGISPEYTLLDMITRKPTTELFYRTATVNGKVIATVVSRTSATVTAAGTVGPKMVDAIWVDRNGRQLSFIDGLNLQPMGPATQLTIRPYAVYFGTLDVAK